MKTNIFDKKQDDIIILCQAPADVAYLLTLYEKYKNERPISIFVINVKAIYEFIFSLNLQLTQIVFIPYRFTNLKNIRQLFQERKRINTIWMKYFSTIKNAEVYFFSRFEDWLTAAFIHRFSKNLTITLSYVNHYDNSSSVFIKNKNTSIKLRIYLSLLKFLTNVAFTANIREKFPEFPINNYPIKEIHIENNNDIFVKYQYKLDIVKNRKPNLLFFLSPCENTIFNPKYYNNNLTEIIQLFNEIGFNVIIKGHPRLGIPTLADGIIKLLIPAYVPGEFIETKQISLCLGLDTNAICHPAKNTKMNTYSVIKLFQYSNKGGFDSAIEYLNLQSEGKIKYCNDFQELKQIAFSIIKKAAL